MFFPFDTTFLESPRGIIFQSKYGARGLGVYTSLLLAMSKSSSGSLEVSELEYVVGLLGVEEQFFVEVLTELLGGKALSMNASDNTLSNVEISRDKEELKRKREIFAQNLSVYNKSNKLHRRLSQTSKERERECESESESENELEEGSGEETKLFGTHVKLTSSEVAELKARYVKDGLLEADVDRGIEKLDVWLSDNENRKAVKARARRSHYKTLIGWPLRDVIAEAVNRQKLENAQKVSQKIENGNNGFSPMASPCAPVVRQPPRGFEVSKN
jgi:hypothetical protein